MRLEHDRYEVRYTATLITPEEECDTPEECSCSNVYGEWCEHGNGETLETGWHYPGDIFEVYEERPERPTDVVDTGDEADAEELAEDYDGDISAMLADIVGARLGAIDSSDGLSFYAADPITHYGTGARVTLAAHVEHSRYHVTPGQAQLLEVS